MKRISFVVLAILASLSIKGQNTLTPALQEVLNKSDNNDYISIRIEFKENVDCYFLNNELKENKTTISERPKIVIQQLQEQANLSQSDLVNEIKTAYEGTYRNLQRFWAVNLIILEAKPELIDYLNTLPSISLIDYENSKIVMHDAFEISSEKTTRAPGGIENGLQAINAPAMWALGYTGRGRIVYDYDTGVWPDHPSFTNRYMGNFYPTSQSWFPWESSDPSGIINNHGTHTLGTIAGLDTTTQDTIGVAFNSYWIANDYVNTTVATLPPIADMILAFEWALNPDGNINTTSDIPDVISNSWRWYDINDTVQCDGYVVNLMNAIETAGIANVFAGGNFGPSNVSVSAPQRINTTEVNTFSVGSVNGNFAFPYPISSFSSIGPTQCPGTGSLSIHPEVVAPGQDVRSAWGSDGYNTISGTSMATPHVSGAILLLKEAFPYLTGEDLLWALYLTAIDLGPVGEDNTYGMGIIDVHAAFLYLSATNTPVDPTTEIKWDLAITEVTNPSKNEIVCTDTYSPTVTLKNLGDSTITSIDFTYSINGGVIQNANWTGNLVANSTILFNLPAITATSYGNQELSIITSITGNTNEYDLINNRRLYSFNRRGLYNLPYIEDFENGLAADRWQIENPDNASTWETVATQGLQWSGQSISMQFYNYSPRESQKDGLISPELIIPSTGITTLKFDRAYQKKSSSTLLFDTLQIFVSTDCGQTFPTLIYEKYGDSLSSLDTLKLDFVPEFISHWEKDSVDLSAFNGMDILLKFQGVNRQGNNLYLDNIMVYQGANEPINVTSHQLDQFSVYPNPASEVIVLDASKLSHANYSIEVLNSVGKLIHHFETKNTLTSLDISGWAKGIYLISIKSDLGIKSERIIIQ